MQEVAIRDEYITLGQFLKLIGAIGTGGQARNYLAETPVEVNGEPENRRGRKLRPGDTVSVPTVGAVKIVSADHG